MTNASSSTPEIDQYSFAVATGDYNNDGFPDIVSHQIGNHAIVLAGVPNDNHYLKIRPEGVTVNRDAIGAKVEVFHSGGVEMNVVFCGDKYLAQNSRHLHFGLGGPNIFLRGPGGGGRDTGRQLLAGGIADHFQWTNGLKFILLLSHFSFPMTI